MIGEIRFSAEFADYFCGLVCKIRPLPYSFFERAVFWQFSGKRFWNRSALPQFFNTIFAHFAEHERLPLKTLKTMSVLQPRGLLLFLICIEGEMTISPDDCQGAWQGQTELCVNENLNQKRKRRFAPKTALSARNFSCFLHERKISTIKPA